MDEDRNLGNKVIDFSYDGFNSNNYDFLIGKFNDFIIGKFNDFIYDRFNNENIIFSYD